MQEADTNTKISPDFSVRDVVSKDSNYTPKAQGGRLDYELGYGSTVNLTDFHKGEGKILFQGRDNKAVIGDANQNGLKLEGLYSRDNTLQFSGNQRDYNFK